MSRLTQPRGELGFVSAICPPLSLGEDGSLPSARGGQHLLERCESFRSIEVESMSLRRWVRLL